MTYIERLIAIETRLEHIMAILNALADSIEAVNARVNNLKALVLATSVFEDEDDIRNAADALLNETRELRKN